jgi:hypothetical protein
MPKLLVPSGRVHQGQFAFLETPDEVLPAAVALQEPVSVEEACDAVCEMCDALSGLASILAEPRNIRLFVNAVAPKRRLAGK